VAVQAAVIAELRVVNAEQARMIIEVQGRVAELERRLAKDSSTSSKPPSSDGLAKRPAPARQRRAGGRRPGRQPGTPGAHLAQVPDPDEVVVHAPERCAGCGGALTLAAVCCSGRPARGFAHAAPQLSIRNALSVIISLGADRPQSTTSTVPRGVPGGFHQ
jgi:Family of unknown function (DUF6444)